MDKIWDRKSFEVGGYWPLWQGCKKRMTTQNRQKSNAKNPALRQHFLKRITRLYIVFFCGCETLFRHYVS